MEVTTTTTTEPTEAEAAAAHAVHEEIRGAVKAMRSAWVWLAERLYHFNQQKMWIPLGYRTFDEYLASPEIELGRRQVYALIEAWRELIIERGLDPKELEDAEVSKVREVMPAVRKGTVSLEEAIADAKSLGREDLRLRYAKAGAGLSSPHGPGAHPGYTVCPTCGSRVAATPTT